MTRATAALVRAVGILAVLLCVSPADAQGNRGRARARQLYGAGQELFRDGDYVGARQSFEKAYEALPNPVVLLSIAECQVRVEQYREAVATLKRYLTERPDAPDRDVVEQQLEALQTKPAILIVESIPAGAAIGLDGEPTGHATPSEIEVPPGEHSLTLELPGYVALEHMVSTVFGGRERLELKLSPAQVAQAPIDAPPAEPPPVAETGRHAGPAVWVATSVAAAGAVTGAVLGGLALKKYKSYKDTPSESLADKGDRIALFADVGFGVAVAGGVTALVLYLTSAEEEDPEQQAWGVTPAVRGGRYGLVGNLNF